MWSLLCSVTHLPFSSLGTYSCFASRQQVSYLCFLRVCVLLNAIEYLWRLVYTLLTYYITFRADTQQNLLDCPTKDSSVYQTDTKGFKSVLLADWDYWIIYWRLHTREIKMVETYKATTAAAADIENCKNLTSFHFELTNTQVSLWMSYSKKQNKYPYDGRVGNILKLYNAPSYFGWVDLLLLLP